MENQNVTMEQAIRILANRVIVAEAGVCDTAITVGNVSVGTNIRNEAGEITGVKPFYWENADGSEDLERPYYIVNLRAMSDKQAEHAEELLDAGLYEDAVGSEKGAQGNFSLRMSPEDVKKNGIGTGAIVRGTFDYRLNSEDEEVLVCVGIAPIIAKAKSNPFKSRITKPEVKQTVENA